MSRMHFWTTCGRGGTINDSAGTSNLPMTEEDEDEAEEDVVPGLQKTKKKAQLSKTLVNKGDGVDLYVDGARLLPDNVTVSRVVSTVMYGSGAQQKVRLPSFSFPCLSISASVQTTAHRLLFSFFLVFEYP